MRSPNHCYPVSLRAARAFLILAGPIALSCGSAAGETDATASGESGGAGGTDSPGGAAGSGGNAGGFGGRGTGGMGAGGQGAAEGGGGTTGESTGGAGGSPPRTDFMLGSVETLAENQGRVVRLELDADYVYYATLGGDPEADGTVQRVARDGGPAEELLRDASVNAIALHGGYLYWGSAESRWIKRMPLDQTGPDELVARTDQDPADLYVGANYVTWTSWLSTPRSGGLSRAPLDGGEAELLYTHQEALTFLIAEPPRLLASEMSTLIGAGRILEFDTSGAATSPLVPMPVVTDLGRPRYVAVGTDHYYYTDEQKGLVARTAKAGGPPEILATDQTAPYGLALDPKHIYWTNYAEGGICETEPVGNVVARPYEGEGEPFVLVEGLACPTEIAVDDRGVYWVSNGLDNDVADGGVQWIPKL